MKGRITTAITKNNSNSNSNSNNNSSNKGLPVNEQIYAKEVRLISETGEVLGVMPTSEALRQARENGFDLVMVTNASSPPVCKLLDYGRHRYELDKRLKDARKKQHSAGLKEITLSYKIGEHDYQVRLKRLTQFLEAGHKVKMTVRLRGREAQHSDLAIQLLLRFSTDTEELSAFEREPKLEGQRIIMILNPKKDAIKKEKKVHES
ncbi:MAG: translation initiation factor IF-3 [Candidatus Sericytochromatia bacterium]|nr:translation initiation factor IF-3 [Candidatus Sericytochromatia bacterium]